MTFLHWCIRQVFNRADAYEDSLLSGSIRERRVAERRRSERRHLKANNKRGHAWLS